MEADPGGDRLLLVIEVWSARTTNGLRVSIMLEELKLDYRAHRVDFDHKASLPAEMLAINAGGAVPVMRDHETGIGMSQSFAIMLYLCEKAGRFLPTDPVGRAATLQWMSYVMTDVIAATHPIFVLTSEVQDTPPHIIHHYEGRLMRFFSVADKQLAISPYLAGVEITVADFALYPTAAFRGKLLDRLGGVPNLWAWMQRMAARPGVARGLLVPA